MEELGCAVEEALRTHEMRLGRLAITHCMSSLPSALLVQFPLTISGWHFPSVKWQVLGTNSILSCRSYSNVQRDCARLSWVDNIACVHSASRDDDKLWLVGCKWIVVGHRIHEGPVWVNMLECRLRQRVVQVLLVMETSDRVVWMSYSNCLIVAC